MLHRSYTMLHDPTELNLDLFFCFVNSNWSVIQHQLESNWPGGYHSEDDWVPTGVERSRRVQAVLAATLMDALERWAKSIGEKPASLAGYILRSEIEKAIADGRVPKAKEEHPQSDIEIAALVAKLIDGEELTPEEEEELAESCNRDPVDINQASRKIRGKNGNGKGDKSKTHH